ncbi:MAG: hypothetical protein A3C43_06325 [Candidatus Schekmanbacteria bacterium RIFCSPHIGHO2_02_FULL_38_11]|uniref:Methyltransferase domain-containing protein n=1 Tax=Candidatus Schekmanbacteria bacterium RIFCSPLOWO2_12_FULL_38_15 TaxID=1817883 RepID=A0A1F7SDL9_9BACT|nr:MAG: hypothetical protein A2043_01770 [Candidatus Schekmanbacteria bacterium GWA2_38_9]OGL48353.1 MAG: hypothetical protein A3H37_05110 [Candidatus Schekmanbacteria bacterium RIFCSPLOWO2_02_FULL_38_14]OGL48489.1 MAG: hypothetical protein A3C43_06325 [Candidatus Schekmanbacteria bacterium RIFCSPHIGHO2_02_FULL_38_11]OGL51879.1 MAG: hypothetical protein A3G31_05715 [Candidatus Schekmanbacteria bacterium RIFCSPLOWO2_12_FULL_38_15]
MEGDKKTIMEFTGERFIPGKGGAQIFYEHLHRYLFAQKLIEGKRILDLGCGEGYGSFLLAMNASLTTGLDLSKEAIQNTKIKYRKENLNFIVGSCGYIPFKNNSFDVVVSFEVIEHIEDQVGMIKEVFRILSRDGILVISSPDKRFFSEKEGILNKFHVKELYREEFVNLLKEHFSEVFLFGQDPVSGSIVWAEDERNNENTTEIFQVNLKENEKFETRRISSYELKNPVFHIAVCCKGEISSAIKMTGISFLNDESKRFLVEKDEMIRKIEELSKIVEEKNKEIFALQQFANKVKETILYKIYKEGKTFASSLISLLMYCLKAIFFLILFPFIALFWGVLILAMIIF